MAAQGALPLTPADLVELLEHLTHDRETEVAAAAVATLSGLPTEDWSPLLKERTTLPRVLAWALLHREEHELREVVLQNATLPDEAVERIAGALPEEQAELVVINQVRLLRRTSLLEALEGNPRLNNDQRRRLRELRESFRIGEPSAEPPPAPAEPEPAAEEELPAPAEEEAEVRVASAGEALVHYLDEDERQDRDKVSVVHRLYDMGVADKVMAALKGSREERAVLVRDPNRLVAAAVLGSPRLTAGEIETFAGVRSLSVEALRVIASHREWTKRYGVISNLVKNPRTPLALTLPMVARLNPRDLKNLAADRGVPEVLRRQAQKYVRTAHERR